MVPSHQQNLTIPTYPHQAQLPFPLIGKKLYFQVVLICMHLNIDEVDCLIIYLSHLNLLSVNLFIFPHVSLGLLVFFSPKALYILLEADA